MGDTDIEWATKVWNPTRGCRRVSPGCENCYAERTAARGVGLDADGIPRPYEGLVRTGGTGGPRWTGAGRFVTAKLDEPLRWGASKGGGRHRIFVDSMSDLFFEAFTDQQIAAVFGMMAACPQHDFLVLTKRQERAARWFEWVQGHANHPREVIGALAQNILGGPALGGPDVTGGGWPLPNVWLGCSVENQEYADKRIPVLLGIPAAVRFLSVEPQIGPVNLHPWLCRWGSFGEPRQQYGNLCKPRENGVGWVIVGGESGPGARPLDLAWARSIIEQCKAAGVPVFVKQLGAKPWDSGLAARATGHRVFSRSIVDAFTMNLKHPKGGDMAEWPADIRVREFPCR